MKKLDKEEIKKRMDYRDVLTFTIDPTDAKDFDDALSFQVKKMVISRWEFI
jgi:ribonuclease R